MIFNRMMIEEDGQHLAMIAVRRKEGLSSCTEDREDREEMSDLS